jgi:hypothetical protein
MYHRDVSVAQEFFTLYKAASRRQQLTRVFVRKALDALPHGFSDFDRTLIHYASLVNDAYDTWYINWAKAMQVISCICLRTSVLLWLMQSAKALARLLPQVS